MVLTKEKIGIIGILGYFFLGIMAFVFYKERVIIFDMAFHTFEIVRTKSLAIQSERFGAMFTQIFPLIAVKLNLPLSQVMILYSLSFVIFPLLAFILSLYIFKSKEIAISILLFSILIVTHTFYWIQSELIQGTIFMLLFWAFVLKKKSIDNFKFFDYILLGGMVITIVFYHPLVIFAFFFIAAFFYFSPNFLSKKIIYVSCISYFLTLIAKSILFFPGKYDHAKMSGLKFFIDLFPNYFTIPINFNFIKYCFYDYYFLLIFLIVVTVLYFKKKEFKKLALLHITFWGYLFLINITNNHFGPQFYVESYYLLLSLFLIIPVVFDVFPLIRNQHVLFGSLILIIVLRIYHIYNTQPIYSKRLAVVNNLLTSTEKRLDKKLIFSEDQVPMDKLFISWSSSYEFLLLSSITNPSNARSMIILKEPNKYDWALGQNDVLLTEWIVFKYKDLPRRYFDFRDRSSYKKME